MKKLLFAFIAIFLVWGVERFCHSKTEGFTVMHTLSDLPLGKEEVLPQEVEKALSQPFTYLGSGGQMYAFLSSDKKIVLKLVKYHHLNSEEEKEKFFNSCHIAYEEFRDECALLYAHPHKTSHLKRKITLIDKLGIHHDLDLDTLSFFLQKKVSFALRSIKQLVKEERREEAERAIRAVVKMVAARCQKGIQDRDNGMRRNMGFLEGRAISIDIGAFSRKNSLTLKEEMRKEILEKTWRLERFLKTHNEDLSKIYHDAIEEVCNSSL